MCVSFTGSCLAGSKGSEGGVNERMEGPRGSSVTFDVEKGFAVNLVRHNATKDNGWRWLVTKVYRFCQKDFSVGKRELKTVPAQQFN